MAYEPYVTIAEYHELGYNGIPDEQLTKFLTNSSRVIDTLTFNRIVHYGFDNLTDFQKDIVQTAVCEQADYMYENNDLIESMISDYSINGVSMKFSPGLVRVDGIPVEPNTYLFLKQTGLCCRLAV